MQEMKSNEFHLESCTPFASFKLSTFKHNLSEFRILSIPIPGPLVTCSIVVPTITDSHKGLPHTLEHLIFCGSESMPYRGYLDNLASRCLSTGSNAYTDQDHTCYEMSTAGSEGMALILPVFMDHILFPTLRQRQFLTEVFHLDGNAKKQGVVFCEMASRENTEADLLDLNLRQVLYAQSGTYSFECGGLTPSIATLTNDQVKEYHGQFYHLNHMTLIVCGMMEPNQIFESLNPILQTFKQSQTFVKRHTPLVFSSLESLDKAQRVRRVAFPSSDDTVGSIGFGWRGPSSRDIFTITALSCLFRYLQGTPASPLYQAFVERSQPLASNIDFELKGYLESSIVLIFSGVPHPSNLDDEDQESGSEFLDSESSLDQEDQDSMDCSESPHDLFEPDVFLNALFSVLNQFMQDPLSMEEISSVIDRQRRKILEALEEDPHETLTSYLIPDVIQFHFGPSSSPLFGTRAQTLDILNDLACKPCMFWKDLARTWLLDPPVAHVLMIPDTKLGLSLSQKATMEQEELVAELGKQGLSQLQSELESALQENKIHLPPSIISQMPPIPDVSLVPQIPYTCKTLDVINSCFHRILMVQTNTCFIHCRFAFNTEQVSHGLRPYLVLFQELLFQSPIQYKDGSNVVELDFETVSNETARLFVSHEAALGFGNDVWTTGWLSEVFMLYFNCEPKDCESSLTFLARVFLYTQFEKSRLISIVSNLLSEITELKRDGMSMLVSVATLVNMSGRQGCNNDVEMSIFKQEPFLKNVLMQLKNGQEDSVLSCLDQLRHEMLQIHASFPGFAQITLPKEFDMESKGQEIMAIWETQVQSFSSRPVLDHSVVMSPFPFPRKPVTLQDTDKSQFSSSILVPMSNLGASFLFQMIECDVMLPHPDYYPISVLVEILSRCEGPLYSKIRGQGLAYGASLSMYLWTGQLCFELSDSSDPLKALQTFYSILLDMETEQGFSGYCNPYEIETAKASLGYRICTERATCMGISTQALKSSLRGFPSLKELDEYNQTKLNQVSVKDLERVYSKYLRAFLDPQSRMTFMTTMKDTQGSMKKAFSSSSLGPFQEMSLDDFYISSES